MFHWTAHNGCMTLRCWRQQEVRGDSYDNAMAESINGLYKAEVIYRQRWKSRSEVKLATLA